MSRAEYLRKIEGIPLVVKFLLEFKFEHIEPLIALNTKVAAISDATTEVQLKAMYEKYCTLIQNEDIRRNGYAPLTYAASAQSKESLVIVKHLLEAGVNPNILDDNGHTPLVHVLLTTDEESAFEFGKVLVDAGADPHPAKGERESSGLIIAMMSNHMKFIDYIISSGFDLSQGNVEGHAAIHMAVRTGNLDALKRILRENVSVNQQNVKGETVLHFQQNAESFQLLLEHGANVNLQDDKGRTPLFNFLEQSEMAKILIEAGANVEHSNRAGKTPRSEAKRINSTDARLTSLLIEQSIAQDSAQFEPEFVMRWQEVMRSFRAVKAFELMTPRLADPKFTITEALKQCIQKSSEFSEDATDEEWIQFANELREAVNGSTLFVQAMGGPKQDARFVDCLLKIKQTVSEEDQALMSQADDSSVIEIFFQAGIRQNIKDKNGKTPLFYAAFLGDLAKVKRCLKEGADVNAVDLFGETPLSTAARGSTVRVLQCLIDAKANVNTANQDDQMPLHLACIHQSTKHVQALLKAGADVNAEDWNQNMPIHYAISHTSVDIVELLIAHGAYVHAIRGGLSMSNDVEKAKEMAEEKNKKIGPASTDHDIEKAKRYDRVATLLVDASKRTLNTTPPLYPLASPGKVFTTQECRKLLKYASQMISCLISRDFYNIQKLDALVPKIQKAVTGNTPDADIRLLFEEYRMLLRAKNILNKLGENIFVLSAKDGNVDNVEHLVQLGFDVNYARPIHAAAMLADPVRSQKIISILYEAGADAHPKNKTRGQPALFAVISKKRTHSLQYFISKGVDISSPDCYGTTALHMAGHTGNLDAIRLLLDAGAAKTINLPDRNNVTALCMLSNKDYSSTRATDEAMCNIIVLMLKHGAEVDIPDNQGRTPLFNMVLAGHVKSAKLLMAAGASTELVDKRGNTLIGIAERNESPAMVRLLKKQDHVHAPAHQSSAASCFCPFYSRRQNQVQPVVARNPSTRTSKLG